jgi:branched-subunit amino acid aminotransferase/4-amino-4-deoxychorismate lyase
MIRFPAPLLAELAPGRHNARMDEPIVYLHGEFIPQSAARLSLTDAGFVQGSAIAEQLRTFGGIVFHLQEHLARLEHSLEIVGVNPSVGWEELAEVSLELAARNHRLLAAGDDLGLSIFITPGEYPSYAPPGPIRPTVCLHTYPLPFRLWAAKYRTGQILRTTEIRQVPPQCWPASLKCRSRMHYHLADRMAAAAEPGARALLLDLEDRVTEASTANVLIYRTGEGLISPPPSTVLPGISLGVVLRLAQGMGLPTVHRTLTLDEVLAADEVLLSSTPLCLLPVTRVNGRTIGRGGPGECFQRLMAAWNDLVGMDIIGQAQQFAERR